MKKNYFFLGLAVLVVLAAGSCKKSAARENQTSRQEDSGGAKPEAYPSYWVMENLKLREQPKTDGKEIQTMQKGTMVQKLDMGEKVTINNIANNWVYVQTENGEKGWCFGGYLAGSKEEAVIIGYWTDEGKAIQLLFLFSNGEYQSGRLESSGEFGTWSYSGGNTIQVDIIGAQEEEKKSFDTAFTVIDNDRVKFGDTVFRRILRKEFKKYGIRGM